MEAILLITSGLVSVVIGIVALRALSKVAKHDRQGLRAVANPLSSSPSDGPY
jgi:hypothetical protein